MIPRKPAAFTAVDKFRSVDRSIRTLVAARLRSGQDVDDGVQMVWEVLMRKLPNPRLDAERGELEAWLTTVANHALANDRRRDRRLAVAELTSEIEGNLSARDPDPASVLEAESIRRAVAAAFESLAERSNPVVADVARRHWLEGETVIAIARSLGLSEAGVWKRLRRAKILLRDSLHAEMGGD